MKGIRRTVESILRKYGIIGSPNSNSIISQLPMIYLGRVTSEIDLNQAGNIEVLLPHLAEPVTVAYSTPYHGKGGSGFFSIPEKDTIVMVAHILDGDPATSKKKR